MCVHAQSCPTLCDPMDCMEELPRLLCQWDFPGKNTGVGCHFLLQGIFPTQGIELASPALPGGFSSAVTPGKPFPLSGLSPYYGMGWVGSFKLTAQWCGCYPALCLVAETQSRGIIFPDSCWWYHMIQVEPNRETTGNRAVSSVGPQPSPASQSQIWKDGFGAEGLQLNY